MYFSLDLRKIANEDDAFDILRRMAESMGATIHDEYNSTKTTLVLTVHGHSLDSIVDFHSHNGGDVATFHYLIAMPMPKVY